MLARYGCWAVAALLVGSVSFALLAGAACNRADPPTGSCAWYNRGGTTGVHYFSCCNNCDSSPTPSCDGTTYQGASKDKLCGHCGHNAGIASMWPKPLKQIHFGCQYKETRTCGGCIGQALAAHFCKVVGQLPGFCWRFTSCFAEQCNTMPLVLDMLDDDDLLALQPLCSDPSRMAAALRSTWPAIATSDHSSPTSRAARRASGALAAVNNTCGNGVCDAGETTASCPMDCCGLVNPACSVARNDTNCTSPLCCGEPSCCGFSSGPALHFASVGKCPDGTKLAYGRAGFFRMEQCAAMGGAWNPPINSIVDCYLDMCRAQYPGDNAVLLAPPGGCLDVDEMSGATATWLGTGLAQIGTIKQCEQIGGAMGQGPAGSTTACTMDACRAPYDPTQSSFVFYQPQGKCPGATVGLVMAIHTMFEDCQALGGQPHGSPHQWSDCYLDLCYSG